MRCRRAFLGPADGHGAGIEVDLVPVQVDQLAHPQAVPEGDKDHGGVAVTPPVVAGRLHQAGDLSVVR